MRIEFYTGTSKYTHLGSVSQMGSCSAVISVQKVVYFFSYFSKLGQLFCHYMFWYCESGSVCNTLVKRLISRLHRKFVLLYSVKKISYLGHKSGQTFCTLDIQRHNDPGFWAAEPLPFLQRSLLRMFCNWTD